MTESPPIDNSVATPSSQRTSPTTTNQSVGPPVLLLQPSPKLKHLGRKAIQNVLLERGRYLRRVGAATRQESKLGRHLWLVPWTANCSSHWSSRKPSKESGLTSITESSCFTLRIQEELKCWCLILTSDCADTRFLYVYHCREGFSGVATARGLATATTPYRASALIH